MFSTTSIAELAKLAKLRTRTDQQLVLLIDLALDRGISAFEKRPPDIAAAGRAGAEAARLLPAVRNVSGRRRLEAKLAELRSLLERGSGGELWQARSAGR